MCEAFGFVLACFGMALVAYVLATDDDKQKYDEDPLADLDFGEGRHDA